MDVSLDSFRTLARSAFFSSRDIVVENDDAHLGNLVFSHGSKANAETMKAFKAALEEKYGFFGTHAFDTVLGLRQQLGKSLRAGDVTATLSQLDAIKMHRYMDSLSRQLDTDPKVLALSMDVRQELHRMLREHPLGDPPVFLENYRTPEDLDRLVSDMIDATAWRASLNVAGRGGSTAAAPLRGASVPGAAPGALEPTGLRLLSQPGSAVFGRRRTSVEDRIKDGALGAGMRASDDRRNPVLLEKLKTNGVEPGFITRRDWSPNDTRGLMADLWSDDNVRALDELVNRSRTLSAMRDGQPPATRRDLAMAVGHAHPAGVAAVAEFVLQRGLSDPNSDIARAFAAKFPGYDPAAIFPEDGGKPTAAQRKMIADLKKEFFLQIREAVMNEPRTSADFARSPVFRHFADRSIVKLDYNEADRHFWRGSAGSSGHFKKPERVVARQGAGYRLVSIVTADKASVGAVGEALANDVTRILGIPAQELSIVRGEYSDGRPKLLLQAQFADGYHDLEDGSIRDGQAMAAPGDAAPLEPLGRYKAVFLALADRDAVGSHGQNKGIVGGRFFAIDPGHSMEHDGQYLEIRDDFSFTDTKNTTEKVKAKRFSNYSVFDDDTRFAKLGGVLALQAILRPRDPGDPGSSPFGDLVRSYKAAFDPKAAGLSADERELREKICAAIDGKAKEFLDQVEKIVRVFGGQLAVLEALDGDPAAQRGAIDTLENLEKLTSPTTWKSPRGMVDLKHLSVPPATRVRWEARVSPNGDIVYSTKGPLSDDARRRLDAFGASGRCAFSPAGEGGGITVPPGLRAGFFAVLSETNVIAEKHPVEALARAMPRQGLDALDGNSSAAAIHDAIARSFDALARVDLSRYDGAEAGKDAAGQPVPPARHLARCFVSAIPDAAKRNLLKALDSDDGLALLAYYESKAADSDAARDLASYVSAMRETLRFTLGLPDPAQRPVLSAPDPANLPPAAIQRFAPSAPPAPPPPAAPAPPPAGA